MISSSVGENSDPIIEIVINGIEKKYFSLKIHNLPHSRQYKRRLPQPIKMDFQHVVYLFDEYVHHNVQHCEFELSYPAGPARDLSASEKKRYH